MNNEPLYFDIVDKKDAAPIPGYHLEYVTDVNDRYWQDYGGRAYAVVCRDSDGLALSDTAGVTDGMAWSAAHWLIDEVGVTDADFAPLNEGNYLFLSTAISFKRGA